MLLPLSRLARNRKTVIGVEYNAKNAMFIPLDSENCRAVIKRTCIKIPLMKTIQMIFLSHLEVNDGKKRLTGWCDVFAKQGRGELDFRTTVSLTGIDLPGFLVDHVLDVANGIQAASALSFKQVFRIQIAMAPCCASVG
jgi:hypothetical protein